MAIVPSRGTVLQQDISSVFTAVAQLTDISISGIEVQTFDSTTLSNIGRSYTHTGYVEGGEVSISGFWDPGLAGHQALGDIITAPGPENWKIIFADTGTTEMPYTSAGTSWEATVSMDDGLKFSSTHKITGLPNLPT